MRIIVFIVAAVCAVGRAVASEPPDKAENGSGPDAVVVTAPKVFEKKELQAAAAPFIRSHGRPATITGQPTDDTEHCQSNVEIIFTPEPAAVLDDVARHHEKLLGFHWVSQTKRVTTFSRPIQAWYVTTTRGANRIEAVDDEIELSFGSSPAGEPGSHFTDHRSSAIVHTLVLVDSNRINGYAIGALSDYIAMLTLSQAQSLDDCGELPSILDLMSSGCGTRPRPDGISPVDHAYLKALYSIDLEGKLPLERSQIHDRMMRELAGH
jgi:hypothetical protein